VQRLRRSLGLRVPPTRRKVVRRGVSTGLPTKAEHRGHVWSWDFISDATTRGGALRMLTILDEYTRECHVLRADRALKSSDVLEWIGRAIAEHGSPAYLRSDNGPEFIAKEVQRWLAANQIKTIYIEPGSPWQNGFVESFHGRLRDECLNREQLWTLTEARVVIEDYRCQYNHLPAAQQAGLPKPKTFRGHNPKRSISGSSLLTPQLDKPRQATLPITKSQTNSPPDSKRWVHSLGFVISILFKYRTPQSVFAEGLPLLALLLSVMAISFVNACSSGRRSGEWTGTQG
jgi:putative transposase